MRLPHTFSAALNRVLTGLLGKVLFPDQEKVSKMSHQNNRILNISAVNLSLLLYNKQIPPVTITICSHFKIIKTANVCNMEL